MSEISDNGFLKRLKKPLDNIKNYIVSRNNNIDCKDEIKLDSSKIEQSDFGNKNNDMFHDIVDDTIEENIEIEEDSETDNEQEKIIPIENVIESKEEEKEEDKEEEKPKPKPKKQLSEKRLESLKRARVKAVEAKRRKKQEYEEMKIKINNLEQEAIILRKYKEENETKQSPPLKPPPLVRQQRISQIKPIDNIHKEQSIKLQSNFEPTQIPSNILRPTEPSNFRDEMIQKAIRLKYGI